MQTLFPEIWSEDLERADELRRISVEVLSDWGEYAPLLKYLRAAEVHTLADVALLRPEDIATWHGVGPSRQAMFVRLLQHLTDKPGDFISHNDAERVQADAEAMRGLGEISLSMLMDRHETQMLCRPLMNAGVRTLADLVDVGTTRLSRIRDIGKSRRTRIEALRLDVLVHQETYIRQWQDFRRQHAYPLSHVGDDSRLSLARFEEIIATMIADFEPYNQKLGRAARLYYKEQKPIESIAKTCRIPVSRLRRVLLDELVLPLSRGEEVLGFTIRSLFVRQAEELRRELLYHYLPSRSAQLSRIAEDFLRLEICSMDSQTPAILVASGEQRVGRDTVRLFLKYMGAFAQAQPVETLRRELSVLAIRHRAAYSEAIADVLVNNHPWVESIKDASATTTYRMSASHLTDDVARLCRIVMDAGREISGDEVLRRYASLYGQPDETFVPRLQHLLRVLPRRDRMITARTHEGRERYSLANTSKAQMSSLSELIPALIERLGYEFTLEQMEVELARFGYTRQNQQTLHTIITRYCCTDMDFIHHYCHKAHTAEHPDIRWRLMRTRSVSVLIRDYVRSLLRQRLDCAMPLSEVIDELTAFTRIHGYAVRDIKARLFAFTAPNAMVAEQLDKPFYFNTHDLSIDICLR